MRLITLVENETNCILGAEHGLCVYIEFNGKNYLLDTGASSRFLENAKALDVDISKVDTAVLSHAHYDHSGGYEVFFKENQKAKVYLRKEALDKCWKCMGDQKKYIGIPSEVFEDHKDRLELIEHRMTKLDENVFLIAHSCDLSERGKKVGMYREYKEGFAADNFMHEQSLVFKTEKGLVILNSCCHSGVDIVAAEAKGCFEDVPIYAVIGGFHLMGATGTDSMNCSKEDIQALSSRLDALDIGNLYTGHCTGLIAYELLKENLGEKVRYLSTGTILEI